MRAPIHGERVAVAGARQGSPTLGKRDDITAATASALAADGRRLRTQARCDWGTNAGRDRGRTSIYDGRTHDERHGCWRWRLPARARANETRNRQKPGPTHHCCSIVYPGTEQIREQLKLDKREQPRVLYEGLKTKALKNRGQKRATVYTAA